MGKKKEKRKEKIRGNRCGSKHVFFFFIGGDEIKDGEEGQRGRERERGRKVGGRTDLSSDKKFISINNHKKSAGRRARKTGMVFWRLAVQKRSVRYDSWRLPR